jgi:hypothetical protein
VAVGFVAPPDLWQAAAREYADRHLCIGCFDERVPDDWPMQWESVTTLWPISKVRAILDAARQPASGDLVGLTQPHPLLFTLESAARQTLSSMPSIAADGRRRLVATLDALDAAAPAIDRHLYDVRYDGDESYYVVATFSREADAERLRERLAASHLAADRDGCFLDSAWYVTEIDVDDFGAEDPLPPDMFDVDEDGGHAEVAYERFPLGFAALAASPDPREEPDHD